MRIKEPNVSRLLIIDRESTNLHESLPYENQPTSHIDKRVRSGKNLIDFLYFCLFKIDSVITLVAENLICLKAEFGNKRLNLVNTDLVGIAGQLRYG